MKRFNPEMGRMLKPDAEWSDRDWMLAVIVNAFRQHRLGLAYDELEINLGTEADWHFATRLMYALDCHCVWEWENEGEA